MIVDVVNEFINTFEKDLEKVLIEINTLAGIKLVKISERDILKYENIWQEILIDAGYINLISDSVKNFNVIHPLINEELKKNKLFQKMEEKHLLEVKYVKEMYIKDLRKIGMDAGTTIKKNLYKLYLAGTPEYELVNAVRKELEGTKWGGYSKTYMNTAINDYTTLVFEKKIEGLTKDIRWVYEGIQDNKTRSFCNSILNKNISYTTSEKDNIKNDYRRRYNCRHYFVPVKTSMLKDLGFEDNIH